MANEKKNTVEKIPYIVYEAEMYKAEKRARRWLCAFFIALALAFFSRKK